LPTVLKKNLVFSSEHLILKVHLGSGNPLFGLAVITPIKIIKKSTDRHLIKRRIHQVIKKNLLLIKKNIDLIVQIKKSPLEIKFIDLESELVNLLNQANVLNK